MQGQNRDLIARDILAAVGGVLYFWGLLENELLDQLGPTDAPNARSPPLQRWRDAGNECSEIEDAARLRNLLAHGLMGLNARPKEGEPRVSCRDLEGSIHDVTYDALLAAAEAIDQLRLRMQIRYSRQQTIGGPGGGDGE